MLAFNQSTEDRHSSSKVVVVAGFTMLVSPNSPLSSIPRACTVASVSLVVSSSFQMARTSSRGSEGIVCLSTSWDMIQVASVQIIVSTGVACTFLHCCFHDCCYYNCFWKKMGERLRESGVQGCTDVIYMERSRRLRWAVWFSPCLVLSMWSRSQLLVEFNSLFVSAHEYTYVHLDRGLLELRRERKRQSVIGREKHKER